MKAMLGLIAVILVLLGISQWLSYSANPDWPQMSDKLILAAMGFSAVVGSIILIKEIQTYRKEKAEYCQLEEEIVAHKIAMIEFLQSREELLAA